MKSEPHVAGVILAAGEAKRMGCSKVLLPYQEGTILEAVIKSARRSPLAPVVIVLGHDADKIQTAAAFDNVEVVINKNFRQGQSSSLKAGLCKVPDTCQGVMFLLGDQPRVTPATIKKIVNSFNPDKDLLVVPICRGRRGTPVIVHSALFSRIMQLEGDVGARPLFREFSHQIHWVGFADGQFFMDVDTPADYQRLLKTQNQVE